MSLVNIPSYEGSSPFIYVYYSEDDTRLALPVLARLYNEGLRMWSWNGCAQPTDVRASQRISSCAALLVFLSENLDRDIQRGNFEAMEALRCNKVKYFVRLSDMELPFDWGKSDANVVIDYVRSNEAAFWLSIYDSDIIEGCRGAWPSKPVKVGMSVFDNIDSAEVSDEYSSILKIIGKAPALDRSGAPVHADDIALFAGAGEAEEREELPEEVHESEPLIEDLNNKSMQDLFGMLDEISVSTRQKAEELQQSAEKRRAEQEKAAMARASLPFEQDAVKSVHSDEPPVPALSFTPAAMAVEEIAAEMFGIDLSEAQLEEADIEPIPEKLPEIVIIEDIVEKEEAPAEPEPTFEEFIDDLAGVNEPEVIEEIPEEPEMIEEPAFVPLPTHPKTVEITEETERTLLPPATGSLTGFTLPDDNYMSTVYVFNDDEDTPAMSAAERAAAAEESRKQFESALEKAAFKVTGRIVARHSKGIHSVGLRVRKPKTVKLAVHAKVKPVKVSATPKVKETAQSESNERRLSRAERRERRRRKESEPVAAEIPAEHKVTVTPSPMRGEMPASAPVSASAPNPVPAPISAPALAEAPVQGADENAEAAVSRRKKRHPHNSSGLLGILRELKSQKDAAENENTALDEEI